MDGNANNNGEMITKKPENRQIGGNPGQPVLENMGHQNAMQQVNGINAGIQVGDQQNINLRLNGQIGQGQPIENNQNNILENLEEEEVVIGNVNQLPVGEQQDEVIDAWVRFNQEEVKQVYEKIEREIDLANIEEIDHIEHVETDRERKQRKKEWDSRIKEMNQEIESLIHYYKRLEVCFYNGMLTQQQYFGRLKIIKDMWKRSEYENVPEEYEESYKEYTDDYNNVMYSGVLESSDDFQLDLKNHLTDMGYQDNMLKDKDNAERSENPDELPLEELARLDKWLLIEYERNGGSPEDSLVYSFLSRPRTERIFGYHLMQIGYPKKTSELDVLVFNPEKDVLDEKKIKKDGLDLSKLGQVYRQMCQFGPVLENMNNIRRLQEEYKNDGERDQEEELQGLAKTIKEIEQKLTTQVGKIEVALNNLNAQKTEYDNSNFIMKKFRKGKVKKAVESLSDELDKLLETEVRVPGQADISNLMDYVKFTVMGATGAKTVTASAGGVMMKLKNPLVAGVGTVGSYAANIGGGLLGFVNMVLAVAGIARSYKSFAALNSSSKLMLCMDFSNQVGSSVSSMASSVTGTLKVAGFEGSKMTIASGVTAAAGVVVGIVSAGVGVLNYTVANDEEKQRENAFGKLKQERKSKEETTELKQTIRFEDNIEKIMKRINTRKKITAGCQMLGGMLTAGASLLSFELPIAAAAFGLLGLGTLALGAVTTFVMKKRARKKVVDEFLNLDAITNERIERVSKEGRKLKKSAKDKIREQTRQELMETLGCSSVKECYIKIMGIYANRIYEKIQLFLSDEYRSDWDGMQTKPSKEEEAYRDLVDSLGLEVNADKKLPTVQMIYCKLTS